MRRDYGPADPVPVAEPAGHVRHDGGEHIWRRREQLGLSAAEAHAVPKDDGQEVRVGIAGQRRGHEVEGPEVEPPVTQVAQDRGRIDAVFFGVAAVLVDAREDEVSLGGLEELARLGGEVDYDEAAEAADGDGDGAFDYEDPFDRLFSLAECNRAMGGCSQLQPLRPPLPRRRVRT